MTTKTIETRYLNWLIEQIEIPVRNPNTYFDLFNKMYEFEFYWSVPNDDNRAHDALELRREFLDGRRHNFVHGASILEVLIALSRRVAFIAGGDPRIWAWQLIENLRLHKASDPLVGEKARRVNDTLEALVWRTYRSDGRGGFFPLVAPLEDQTKIEIWAQMNAYVNEMIQPS